jgi:hypothetical protein
MNEPFNDDCITVRVVDVCRTRLDGITSVFIKREGRDPTLQDLKDEAAAYDKEHDTIERHLLAGTGIQPSFGDRWDEVERQLDNFENNSDSTPYRCWDQNPVCPTNSKVPTSRTNPVDLTNSDQWATNRSIEKQRTDLRQTNAESVRSSPSISTRTSCLNINTPAKQGPVSE